MIKGCILFLCLLLMIDVLIRIEHEAHRFINFLFEFVSFALSLVNVKIFRFWVVRSFVRLSLFSVSQRRCRCENYSTKLSKISSTTKVRSQWLNLHDNRFRLVVFVIFDEHFRVFFRLFRETKFISTRGLWSPEASEEEKEEIFDHQWSTPSTAKSVRISPFRQAANEIERLQREARELARRKAEEEQFEQRDAHQVVQLCSLLEQVKNQRNELESTREAIIRQIQQLHAQITVRRKEGSTQTSCFSCSKKN